MKVFTEYKPEREVVYVWVELESEREDVRFFKTLTGPQGFGHEIMEVLPGAEPPLYCPPIDVRIAKTIGDAVAELGAERAPQEENTSGEGPAFRPSDGLGLSFAQYQTRAFSTAFYPHHGEQGHAEAIAYCVLKLNGEAGEVAEKVGKVWREGNGFHELSPAERTPILEELGDVLWYIAALASEWGVNLETIAAYNLEKLAARAAHGPDGWSDARKNQVFK